MNYDLNNVSLKYGIDSTEYTVVTIVNRTPTLDHVREMFLFVNGLELLKPVSEQKCTP